MIIKRRKQIVIKQRTNVHTEARYFALKLDLNGTNKERKYNKELNKNSFSSKLINGDPDKVREDGKKSKNL